MLRFELTCNKGNLKDNSFQSSVSSSNLKQEIDQSIFLYLNKYFFAHNRKFHCSTISSHASEKNGKQEEKTVKIDSMIKSVLRNSLLFMLYLPRALLLSNFQWRFRVRGVWVIQEVKKQNVWNKIKIIKSEIVRKKGKQIDGY